MLLHHVADLLHATATWYSLLLCHADRCTLHSSSATMEFLNKNGAHAWPIGASPRDCRRG
uniref:Uncharacterized protein n=1 Tax=Arundo donax TaxID=35708 RepID=A0A0A8ZDJ6_ARUDO